MRTRTKLTCIEIPLIVVLIHAASLDLVEQLLIVLLTDRTANDLANAREEHVSALHRLAVSILLHIERLDLRRIVGHNHRTLEVLLYKIALMLTAEVHAPTGDREFELMSVLDSLLQDADALGIRQAYEILLDDRLQRSDQRLVDHLVEELQVVLAVVQGPLHAVLDEVFLKIHQLVLVDEGNLRLDHPELSQVARRITVLSAESRTEGVDGT